jgi:transcriptional regulator NrdR family protein
MAEKIKAKIKKCSSAFDTFERLAKAIIAVPKKELEAKRKKFKKDKNHAHRS